MGIIIYGTTKATCSQRVLLTLIEKGVTDYELKVVNMRAGEHKQPEHLKKQPFGVIPVLEDGDFILHESRAICYYIASKYADQGPKLLPDAADLKGNAMFQQWASVERDNWDKYVHPMIFEKIIRVNLHGSSPDLKVLKDNEAGFVPKLDVFEDILSKQQYMGGNEFSLIDIYCVPYTQKLFEAGYGHLITDRSHVNAWWERVSGRESWQEVLALP